jgi:hypothetical protein
MLELRVNNIPLVLPPGTAQDIEFINSFLSEGLEDAFSMPLRAPWRGNEATLGFLNELALRERTVRIERVQLWYQGTPRHVGVLYTEHSDDDGVDLSFSVEGFISRCKELKMGEMDLGPTITVDNIRDHAKAVSTLAWPAAPYAFPMHYNPEFYSPEGNPHWFPDRREWEAGSSYAINDLVTYRQDGIIAREWDYQCIVANSGSTPPPDAPAQWRRVAFGICNHWDWENDEYFANNEDGNFFNLVPWFYLKELLTRAARALGYRVAGDFMEDVAYNSRVVYSNYALDGGRRTMYFRASQVDEFSHEYGDTTPVRLQAPEDSTAPNTDPDSVWDTAGFIWKVPEAGSFLFKVHVKQYQPNVTSPGYCTCYMRKEGTDQFYDEIYGQAGGSDAITPSTPVLGEPGWWEAILTFGATFPSGSIGEEWYFDVNSGVSSRYQDCWVQGWKLDPDIINGYINTIRPADHAPDCSFGDLLLSLRDEFRLRIAPLNGELRLDYLRGQDGTPLKDITPQVRSTVGIDTSSAHSGLTIGYDIDTGDIPDLSKLLDRGRFVLEADLPAPFGPGEYAVVLSTRQLYISEQVLYDPYFVWKPRGWYLPARTFGDAANAQEIKVLFGPLFLDRVDTNGKQAIVPTITEGGQSSYFRSGANPPSPRMANYLGQVPFDPVCAGAIILTGAGIPGVDGTYCPDTVGFGGMGPSWTKVGGTYGADTIYQEPAYSALWIVTSGGLFATDSLNAKYYNLYGPPFDTGSWSVAETYYDPPGGGVAPVPTNGSPTGPTYPLATPFAYGDKGLLHPFEMDFNSAYGPLDKHWLILALALAQAELLEVDIEVDPAMLIARTYELIVLMHHQRCLIESLPITYGDGRKRMIARGTRLLRLPAP